MKKDMREKKRKIMKEEKKTGRGNMVKICGERKKKIAHHNKNQ